MFASWSSWIPHMPQQLRRSMENRIGAISPYRLPWCRQTTTIPSFAAILCIKRVTLNTSVRRRCVFFAQWHLQTCRSCRAGVSWAKKCRRSIQKWGQFLKQRSLPTRKSSCFATNAWSFCCGLAWRLRRSESIAGMLESTRGTGMETVPSPAKFTI